MEFWPAVSNPPARNTASKSTQKNKAASREAGEWTNYPVVNHGSLTAATMVKIGDSFQWTFVQSQQRSQLRQISQTAKVLPPIRPPIVSNGEMGLQRRAEQGANYLRTYHPDIDIPFDIIKDELNLDNEIAEELKESDPYQGNTLLAIGYSENDKRKNGFLLAFPVGKLGRDLNISPIQLRNYTLTFQPFDGHTWSFDTPIRQIVTSSPATQLVPRRGHHLAVRTYRKLSVFDVKWNPTSSIGSTTVQVSEAFTLEPEDFILEPGDLNGRNVMDMFLFDSTPAELCVVTDDGAVYHCSLKGENKAITPVCKPSEGIRQGFWRICADNTGHGGLLASSSFIKHFDTRSHVTTDVLSYDREKDVITSICSSGLDHIFCVGTTSEVLWIDDRYPLHPLLGWRHHRNFDKTISVQSLSLGETSFTFLSSLHNNIVTAIAVNKITNGPLQIEMPPRALPKLMAANAVGRTIINHPHSKRSKDSFGILEMCTQGSIHHAEFQHDWDLEDTENQSATVTEPSSFKFHWSDAIVALDEAAKGLRPDYGKMAERDSIQMDLSELYQRLFGEEADDKRAKSEEENQLLSHETIEMMPSFWQHSEDAGDHMHTLFDVAFGSGEEPTNEARADFLTGTSLDSSRGHWARRSKKLPLDAVREKAAWKINIQDTLKKLAPEEFESFSVEIDAAKLDPYEIEREEENPVGDRKETEAREQVALDLALSMDVFSPTALKTSPAQQNPEGSQEASVDQEPSAMLSRATEQMTLSQKEPPQVTFSYFRPINKDNMEYYKKLKTKPVPHTEEEDKETEMPLGVRLLLSDWTVGEDPSEYRYVDPYDLDGTEAQQQFYSQVENERRGRPHKQRDTVEGMNERTQGPAQSQAPPTIVAAKTLANSQPAKVPTVARSKAQMQTQPAFSFSQQTELVGPPSSQPPMMNTQVLPGPFGGRPAATAKKKAAKKRVGGF